MVHAIGETEAGAAGKQPARDSRAWFRQEAERWENSTKEITPPDKLIMLIPPMPQKKPAPPQVENAP